MNTKIIGNAGENIVEIFLKNKKCDIVLRNYNTKYGEIDIIAKNEEYIIFVEVKTRSKISEIRPSDSINRAKVIKILKTANMFLSTNEINNLQPRIDVAEVIVDKDTLKMQSLNYIKNAVEEERYYYEAV